MGHDRPPGGPGDRGAGNGFGGGPVAARRLDWDRGANPCAGDDVARDAGGGGRSRRGAGDPDAASGPSAGRPKVEWSPPGGHRNHQGGAGGGDPRRAGRRHLPERDDLGHASAGRGRGAPQIPQVLAKNVCGRPRLRWSRTGGIRSSWTGFGRRGGCTGGGCGRWGSGCGTSFASSGCGVRISRRRWRCGRARRPGGARPWYAGRGHAGPTRRVRRSRRRNGRRGAVRRSCDEVFAESGAARAGGIAAAGRRAANGRRIPASSPKSSGGRFSMERESSTRNAGIRRYGVREPR